ncbi:MAG: transcription antitermination factor NusB [bacterium]|nr:transcription antitermination factor NusB [bacterium]
MGQRRQARELALQALYQIEMLQSPPEEVLPLFWKGEFAAEQGNASDLQMFTNNLVQGTFQHRKEIDQLIEESATHWKLSRMAVVDRNILRMAVYELLYGKDIPVNVTLNEAIEIAKCFGTEDSGSFINGILDKVSKEMPRK